MPDDEIFPHREETCPFRERIILTTATVNQIMNTLEKIERRLCEHADDFDAKFEKMMEILQENFVTKDQFMPVKILVYGLTGTLLTGVITALVMHTLMK